MRHNSTIIPNGRDDTWDTTEVHRKTPEEMFSTAFNLEQQKALLAMFSQGGSGGGDCDCGYECKEEYTLLTDESVTIVAGEYGNEVDLAYSSPITADTIKVTFNGVEYTCQKTGDHGEYAYGAPYDRSTSTSTFDWSEYPFNIMSDDVGNLLTTETAGTYQVKIEAVEESVETSVCFEKAVKKVGGGGGTDIIVIRSSELRKPTVGGVARNNVYFNDCYSGDIKSMSIALWDKFDDYKRQPIIFFNDGNHTYTLAASIDNQTLCASNKTEDASSGNSLALRNDTDALILFDSSEVPVACLVSPDTEFYKWCLK